MTKWIFTVFTLNILRSENSGYKISYNGYKALNLIEIRKLWKDKILTQKIRVGKHEYDY